MKLFKYLGLTLFILIATVTIRITTVEAQNFPDSHHRLSKQSMDILRSHDIIIDDYFFSTPNYAAKLIVEKLIPKVLSNSLKRSRNVPVDKIRIAIASHGGYVSILDATLTLDFIKNEYIICTIGDAASAAFTLMMSICDERKILPNAFLLTHPAL